MWVMGRLGRVVS
jgi:hypothetical protein